MNILLWILQILLTLLFLFAGGSKFYYSIEQMRAMGPPDQILLPGLLLHFIGVCFRQKRKMLRNNLRAEYPIDGQPEAQMRAVNSGDFVSRVGAGDPRKGRL